MDPMTIAAAAQAVLPLITGPGAPAPPGLPQGGFSGMKASDAITQLLSQTGGGQVPTPQTQQSKVHGTFADAAMPDPMAQAMVAPKTPKATPHNKTLKETALAPISAPKSSDLKPIPGVKEKGAGFFGDMSDMEKAALGMSLASQLFAKPQAPAPPGLPHVGAANMRPTF